MARYLILCQSEISARALVAWRELLGDVGQMPSPIVFVSGSDTFLRAYETLVDRVTAQAGPPDAIGETVVIVDSVLPENMSAIAEGQSWDHLIALLVLAFPDIRWLFGVIGGEAVGFPTAHHALRSFIDEPWRESLLDPTGLREWVKSRTNAALARLAAVEGHDTFELPRRAHRAASIDEELDYAFMHGYASFRYGFRADLVTSWSLMETQFGPKSGAKGGGHGYSLLLEDVRLNFADKPSAVHLSRLGAERSHHCPLLANERDLSKWRFLVTTGQVGRDKDLMRENADYLAKRATGRWDVLYKPVGGIVDLWEKAKLTEDLVSDGRPGNAPGFSWPPAYYTEILARGHGSPGKLALVASTLISRARDIRKDAETVPQLIRGAVFAVEASELLGGRTPTLTLTALSFKHEFEVRAECAFIGSGFHLGLKRRFGELSTEVAAAVRFYREESQANATRDATASILSRLALAFREAGQVEEEHECLRELRSFNRKICRPRGVNPAQWIAHGLLAYSECLLGSFSLILGFTAAWILIVAGGAWWIGSQDIRTFMDATSKAVSWFVGGGAEWKALWQIMVISWLAALGGALHIGILVSYLYSLIARK